MCEEDIQIFEVFHIIRGGGGQEERENNQEGIKNNILSVTL